MERTRRPIVDSRTPAWQCLVSPAFRLATFAMVACYVEVLLAEGHSLATAVFAAVGVGLGAWASTVSDPFGRLAPAQA